MKKGLIGTQDSYQDRLVLFNEHIYYRCVAVQNSRLKSKGYWFKQKRCYKLSMNDFPKLYSATLEAHPCSTSHLLELLAAACISRIKFGIRLDYDNTTPADYLQLFSRDDYDCSVIYTWGTDKSKAVIEGVTVSQTSREHLPENGS